LDEKSERVIGKNWNDICWLNKYEYNNNNAMYRVVKGRCNDIEKQNLFSRLSEKISLLFYQEMKQ
jgi:hypothetical protein